MAKVASKEPFGGRVRDGSFGGISASEGLMVKNMKMVRRRGRHILTYVEANTHNVKARANRHVGSAELCCRGLCPARAFCARIYLILNASCGIRDDMSAAYA